MKDNSDFSNHRRLLRLPKYDYSWPGNYFVTICTRNKMPYLGKIKNDEMFLSKFGNVVNNVWKSIPAQYPLIELDSFVTMPNHIHGIIRIIANDGRAIHELPLQRVDDSNEAFGRKHRRKMLLPRVIGYFKMMSSKRINTIQGTTGKSVWQRNYFEHIIRSEESLNQYRRYIDENPLKWSLNRENPLNT